MRTNDPEVVRREYESEAGLLKRRAVWDSVADGPDARQVAFEAVGAVRPRRVLEVGCGPGEFAERVARELGAGVVAIDLSPRMVELARARGVGARVGDVQELPFADSEFDCVVANWMLYHVPEVDRGLAEIARVLGPGGRLVAATNSEDNLREVWALFGVAAEREHAFSSENGGELLARSFAAVERRDVGGSVVFPDREAVRAYVAASVVRSHLAARVPDFAGPLRARRSVTVFLARKA